MTNNVSIFPKGRIDPDLLLDKAKGWGMERCIIIGLDSDGKLAMGSTETHPEFPAWACLAGQKMIMDWMKDD